MSSGLKDKLKKTFFLPFWLSKGKKKGQGEEHTHSNKDTGF